MNPSAPALSPLSGIAALGVALRVADGVMVVALSYLAYVLRHGAWQMPAPYVGMTLLGLFLYVGSAGFAGLYQPAILERGLLGLPRLAMVLGVSLLGVVAVLFMLKVSDQFSRLWMLGWGLGVFAGLFALRLWAAWFIDRQLDRGRWQRRVALLGAGPRAEQLVRHLGRRHADARLFGLYDLPGGSGKTRKRFFKGDIDRLVADGKRGWFDDLIIAIPLDSIAGSEALLDKLHQIPTNVFYCLPLPLAGRMNRQAHQLAGLPLALVYRQPLQPHLLALKRGVDIVLAALALTAASPFMLLTALAVALTSRGPVLFRQRRGGFNGGEFVMLKFRSMREGSHVNRQARRNDARLTPVGRFIRRTSLDELPQLINVLKGDMSLVGPRPHVPSHNRHYAKSIARYAGRHKIRPGMTGWAQVQGWRGETETLDKMRKRVELDSWYIENWSFGLDVKILLLTPLVVLFQRNAH
jgi:putative colanic acid biosynthesis UDP-glucose lipid carrier transferase